jgi:hypothetical protein
MAATDLKQLGESFLKSDFAGDSIMNSGPANNIYQPVAECNRPS